MATAVLWHTLVFYVSETFDVVLVGSRFGVTRVAMYTSVHIIGW